MNRTRKRTGFSLVELMIVVAIMAILLSIGFPLYKIYAQKAKATEGMNGLGHIRTMQISYKSINDTYLTLAVHPPGDVPSSNQPWGEPGGNWSELGYSVSKTRYQFKGEVGATGNILSSFKLTAQSDLDAKGAPFDTCTLDNEGTRTYINRLK